jgi:hypothetical protein
MNRPHCCPVCDELLVTTTLQECDVTVQFKGENREVHGLATFICENGHIFFVREFDLAAAESSFASSKGAYESETGQ